MRPAYLDKYPHLFQPLVVGKKNLVYKNRIMCGPMQVSGAYSSDANGTINDYGIDYYTDLARGGFASCAVPVEVPRHSAHFGTIRLDEESKGFTFMHILQRSVHAFGMNTACEIYHPGICALAGTCDLMGPSSFMYNGRMVREMTEQDMEDVAQMYVTAAAEAKRSGFDAIMLHYGHGWLMNNFLSPLSNHRKDQYGGSVENRVRFPLMVIKRIREVVGDSMVIEIRMNGNDRAEGGITPDDAAQQALIMQEYVDMFHVSCGTRLDAHARPKMHPTCFVTPGHNIDGSEALKKAGVTKPVGVIGAIHTPELAERILAEGKADYILMGRQSIADPDWVNKIREGREKDIRPCIHCDFCVDGGRRNALTTEVTILNDATFDNRCSVNPLVGQGSARVRAFRDNGKKRVAVVGGGIAGMQAAVAAADKGHDVTLFEKRAWLGGQTAIYPEHLWFKKEIKALREYFIHQVRQREAIKVLLDTDVTPAMVSEADFDAVIVAVGAEQALPPIPGMDNEHVMMAWNVFGNEEKVGKKVVIIGGGSVGCELAISLAEKGRDVTVLEMGPFFAPKSEIAERMSLEEHMDKNGVKVLVNMLCTEIGNDGVAARAADGAVSLYQADTVIISAGSRPLEELRDSFWGTAQDVINVGDCMGPANIRNATDTGWCAGNVL
ncbi:MAG: FAD-dependent oxidoreductase [Mailhella sp.]